MSDDCEAPSEPEATAWRKKLGYEEHDFNEAGKRCGMAWTPWMGDWFTSFSPRNWNTNAEGPWDHWVDLALHILADPLTKIVRPEVYVDTDKTVGFHSEAQRYLTDDELADRFKDEV